MKSRVNNQHGGTIIGLIIGLVVGLSIAVVVAIMITKTATPFTNKLGMTKPSDAAPIQVTDPNKALYGNAYKEPPPDRQPMERPAANVNSAIESTENATKYPDVENVPAPVKAKPALENKGSDNNSAARKSVDEKAAFYLQVGAFRDPSDAENVRAKLALIDVESRVSKKSEVDNLYRVRIGPFDNVDEMNRTRSKLVENSIDVAVIKTPK